MGVQYTGVLLDPDFQKELLDYFSPLYETYLAGAGYACDNGRHRLAHHMTMNMGPCRKKELLGKEVELVLDAWSLDDRVMAVRVKDHSGVYCDNHVPHITVMVNKRRGGKPVHSNDLTNWIPLPWDMVVRGRVTEVG